MLSSRIGFASRIDSKLKFEFETFWPLRFIFNIEFVVQSTFVFKHESLHSTHFLPKLVLQNQFIQIQFCYLRIKHTVSLLCKNELYTYLLLSLQLECIYHFLLFSPLTMLFQDVLWTRWTLCFICREGC
jgi:hypothetical protein